MMIPIGLLLLPKNHTVAALNDVFKEVAMILGISILRDDDL